MTRSSVRSAADRPARGAPAPRTQTGDNRLVTDETEDGHLLPPGARVLHIGPHKTGTTSLQSAFHTHRREAAAAGVHYAGASRQPIAAALSVRAGDAGGPWEGLRREVARQGNRRVVISSEWFADAQAAGISRIVADLDPARLHVVVTLRPLARVLPSQWQQYVQVGLQLDYEPWLEQMLNATGSTVTPTFWHRHRHEQLIDRWAAVVGTDRVVAVVANDTNHGAVLRAFEQLTGLPRGLLVPEVSRRNRSLTRPEAELVRLLHRRLRDAGLDRRVRNDLVLYGATAALRERTPDPAESPIRTPAWAVDEAARIGGEMAAAIAASGIRVIGDLSRLAETGDQPQGAPATGDIPWLEIGATAALGLALAGGVIRGTRPADARAAGDSPTSLATVRLLGLVWHRAVASASGGRPGARSDRASPADPPSADDLAALDALDAACDRFGVAPVVRHRLRGAAEAELFSADPPPGDVDPAAWRAASLGMAVVRAAGSPRRIESVETARLGTRQVIVEVLRRWTRRPRSRSILGE